MMLSSLLHDIVRRRLWPIPALALVIALAAPLLFLKSAPQSAPPVTAAAPAAAPASELPERAQRLLATNDQRPSANSKAKNGQDPFEPPSSHRAKADKATTSASPATKTDGASPGTAGNPVPVVITNADGKTADPKPSDDDAVTAPVDSTTTPTLSSAAVDVRFAETSPTQARVRRGIPRLQTFVADGAILAIFVKYSPNRDKAVFAIAPKTLVTGDVACRRKEGVCRYVDIPAGSHARLTVLAKNGALVTRRLDVVKIDRKRSGASAQAATASTGASQSERKCLLSKLLALGVDSPRIGLDACDA